MRTLATTEGSLRVNKGLDGDVIGTIRSAPWIDRLARLAIYQGRLPPQHASMKVENGQQKNFLEQSTSGPPNTVQKHLKLKIIDKSYWIKNFS